MKMENSKKDVTESKMGFLKKISWKSPVISATIAMIILVVIFTVMNPRFIALGNINTIFLNASLIGIFATGMTMLIISGNIDLSTCSTAAVSAMLMGLLYSMDVPIILASLAGIISGGICGLINGLLVARVGLNSLMVTIGNMLTYRAISYALTDVKAINIFDKTYIEFGRGDILGIPFTVIYMIVFFLVMSFVLGHTTFGRRIYAIGGNIQASFYCGINIKRTQIQLFTLMGFISGFVGLISTAQSGSANPVLMTSREFDFISPCIIGGVSMSGGKGKLLGTFVGCILLAVVANGMVLVNLQSYWQNLVKGLILIFAMSVDAIRNKTSYA